jgi:hypothetical protein
MKKACCSVFLVFLVWWSCTKALGQSPSGRTGVAAEGEQAAGLDKGSKGSGQTDANDLAKRVEDRRIRPLPPAGDLDQEQQEKRREQLLKMRRARLEERRKLREEFELQRFGGELGKGTDPQQQLKTLEAQMAQEEAKHLKRVARLSRIQKLAAESASKQIITRAEVVMRKEQMRYARKCQRFDMRRRMLLRMQERRQRRPPPKPRPVGEGTPSVTERKAVEERRGAEGRWGLPGKEAER